MPSIVVSPENFDASRVVMRRPETQNFVIDKTSLPVTKSKNLYLNDAGEECDFYVQAPTQRIGNFGFQYSYPFGTKDDDKKDPLKAAGMQLEYPLTSLKTVANPTAEEKAFHKMGHTLWELACKHAEKMYEENEEIEDEAKKFLPPVASSAIMAVVMAKKGQDWKRAVKYPFSHPKIKDSNPERPDTTKPLRLYAKLVSQGKQEKLNIQTRIYQVSEEDPEGVKRPATTFIGVGGNVTPLFVVDDTFWGAHGNKSSCGVSIKFKLIEAEFEPLGSGASMPADRMVRRTGAKVNKSTSLDEEEPEIKRVVKPTGTPSSEGDDGKKSAPSKKKGDSKKEEIEDTPPKRTETPSAKPKRGEKKKSSKGKSSKGVKGSDNDSD